MSWCQAFVAVATFLILVQKHIVHPPPLALLPLAAHPLDALLLAAPPLAAPPIAASPSFTP